MSYSHAKQYSILVVDDSSENLRVLTEILMGQGYLVHPAINATVALKAIRNTLPDLILLDILMPEIDGYELCRRLKTESSTRDIPVLFISALNETLDKVKAFEVGGVDYITKPFYPEEILARIRTHLALRDLQSTLQSQNLQLQQEIVERKEAEEALKASQEQLAELNAGKDKLFSIIAHDLKSPLSSLKGLTQFAEEHLKSYTPERLKEMIVMQRTTIENLLKLLENLLTWSRLQRGILEYHPQQIPLAQAFSRTIELFKPMASQKHQTITMSVPEQISVYVDFNIVDTIARNLISNALKFTNSGGSIEITARHDKQQHVEIAISDTGIGIDAQYMPDLFRIDKTYKRLGTEREKGTGLGLVLCKELVERSHGKIWVESEVGKGTSFRFTLPTNPIEESSSPSTDPS